MGGQVSAEGVAWSHREGWALLWVVRRLGSVRPDTLSPLQRGQQGCTWQAFQETDRGRPLSPEEDEGAGRGQILNIFLR